MLFRKIVRKEVSGALKLTIMGTSRENVFKFRIRRYADDIVPAINVDVCRAESAVRKGAMADGIIDKEVHPIGRFG